MAQRTSVSSCQVWSHKRVTRRERLAFSIARPVAPGLPAASSYTLFEVARLTRPQLCPGHLRQR